MATLKDIKGDQIRYLDEDPGLYVGTWSSGGNLNTARAAGGGAGVQTAVISISGIVTNAPSVTTVNNESYDGSAWTEVNNVNTGRVDTHAVGSATAALLFGGQPPYTNATESWDGTNWTTVSSLNTPRGTHTGFGTSTAGLCISGLTAGDALTGNVESWNGSAWTEITDVNQGRAYMSSSTNASQSDGIVFGGTIFPGPFTATTESWNGSAWTEVNDLNTAIANGSGAGISTSALMIAGAAPALTNTTESWDGTNWSTSSNQANSLAYKNKGGGGASNSVAITFSGSNSPAFTTPTFVTSTEEFNFPPSSLTFLQEGMMWFNSTSQTLKGYGAAIASGAWTSGGNLNTARTQGATAGSQTAAISAGGSVGPGGPNYSALSESYNGTSWTEVNDLNQARLMGGGSSGFGTQTAALVAGGQNPPPVASANVESWDGTSWTEITDITTARNGACVSGSQTSGILMCGSDGVTGPVSNVEQWNGTSWTEVADVNSGRYGSGSSLGSTATDTVLFAGSPEPAGVGLTEKWNGTSWTEVADLNTARVYTAGSGTSSSSALCFGGSTPGNTANTESWNGTSWTEVNNLGTAIQQLSGAGSQSSALAVGGFTTVRVATTEEWAVDSTVVTFTTS